LEAPMQKEVKPKTRLITITTKGSKEKGAELNVPKTAEKEQTNSLGSEM
jgi:hypothetical protein